MTLLNKITKQKLDKGNSKKIILDLCGGTGSWSLPYKESGYRVFNLTLPDYNVTRPQQFPSKVLRAIDGGKVYGILAAPPCPMFSFARTNAKTPRDLKSGMELVNACLNIIHACQYRLNSDQQKYSPLKFWALENPNRGMLKWFLGKPAFVFNPYDFGDDYKKETALWGYFKKPKRNPIKPTGCKFDYMKSKDIAPEWFGKLDRKARRAITPRGFALAFYGTNK